MSESIVQIPCPKGTGTIDIDIALLPPEVYREMLVQGGKVLAGRGMSKITKELYPDDAERAAAARVVAEKNLEAMYKGEIKITGAPKAVKVSGKVKTEAMRLAREKVKEIIRANKGKISHYKASEITAVAKQMLEDDPSYIEQAKAILEAREAEPVKVDIMSMIHVDPKLVAASEEKKAKAKATAPLSAKQAGMTKKHKPSASAQA